MTTKRRHDKTHGYHQDSVFKIHGREIEHYEQDAGVERGRLAYAMAILSDCQEMLDTGFDPDSISQELNEAKELMSSVRVHIDRTNKHSLIFRIDDPEQLTYVNTGYNNCPNCRSMYIEGGPVEIDGNYAWQECRCTECDTRFTDLYRLVGYQKQA